MNHKRLGLITPSGFSEMMSKSKDGSAFGKTAIKYAVKVALERLKVDVEEINTPALNWGKDWEPVAISIFEEKYGCLVMPITETIIHPLLSYVGGVPDGFLESDKITEIKCPFNPENHFLNLYMDNIQFKTEYYDQVQGYLEITGRNECKCISFDPRFEEKLQLKVTSIYRDEKRIKEIIEKAKVENDLINEMIEKVYKEL